MIKKMTARRRLVAGAAALALMGVGLLGSATAAQAEVGPDQPNAPTTGTLTINKYKGAPTDTPNQGDLLDGVEFTVTQVGRTVGETCTAIDLTDAADWDGLPGLFASAPDAPATPFCLTSVKQSKDTEDGQALFNLGVGIYFVQETADNGNNNIVSKVPNFYVSIPTSTGAEKDGWNYNVVANPKNQTSQGPSKTIETNPSGLVVGSNVTWNMTVPVPVLNNNEKFDTVVITDTLDSRLDYVADSTTMVIDGTTLTQGTHYTVSGNVVWTLTGPGREILDTKMGKDLTITFKTEVNAVGDGEIVNVSTDYNSQFNGTTVPGTTDPVTYWGQLTIQKNDDSSPVKGLEGAEFQVFAKGTGACSSDAPDTGVVATGTSDANGVVLWDATDPASSPLGLWIGNFQSAQTSPSKDYCVYETKIPSGHTAQAINNPVNIKPGEENTMELTVVNPKKDGPDLPQTGGQGTLAMMLGGLLLVGAGTGALMVSRRRTHNAA